MCNVCLTFLICQEIKIHASAQLQSLVCVQKHGLDFPSTNKLWWNLSC